jgi:hypothetical protein
MALMRMAQLVDTMANGKASKDQLTEIRHLEDRFGLNPLSRRRLGWEFESAADEKKDLPDNVTDVAQWRSRLG